MNEKIKMPENIALFLSHNNEEMQFFNSLELDKQKEYIENVTESKMYADFFEDMRQRSFY
ncbi:MAG: hypothetical protein IJ499_05650 [Clostridia bacterium]|nr:hypothetical protein [Clostridia bacterium]